MNTSAIQRSFSLFSSSTIPTSSESTTSFGIAQVSMPMSQPHIKRVTSRCDQFVSTYKTLNKDDKMAVESFVSSHRALINSLIVLSTVYMPSEDMYDDYALIRDHILIPLFGKEDISHVHFHVWTHFVLLIQDCCYSSRIEASRTQLPASISHRQQVRLQRIHVLPKERSATHSPVVYAERERTFHSRRLRARSLSVPSRGHRDRQHYRSIQFIVFNPQTSEVDDSISILSPSKVAVHIADPTSFISLGSNLDFNASLRSVTYYYPNKGRFKPFLFCSLSSLPVGNRHCLLTKHNAVFRFATG